MRTIDPDSSTPLYRQIAEAIRHRIEAGALAPGESLEPLREAADSWGVSLHTVRHAYASLARDGLLEVRRGPGGTRVRPDVATGAEGVVDDDRGFDAFLAETLHRAEADFGMSPAALAAALRDRSAADPTDERPRVWVVECSRWQCDSHAREIEARYAVDARPWVLGERDDAPPGPAIATYFHFNELRRSWPRRFAGISFVDIRVDPRLGELLRDAELRLAVCERDEPTARAVVADLLSLVPDLDRLLPTIVSEDPDAVIREAETGARVLCPPRVWAALAEEGRKDPRSVEIRYLFDPERLTEVARHRGWPARPAGSSEGVPGASPSRPASASSSTSSRPSSPEMAR